MSPSCPPCDCDDSQDSYDDQDDQDGKDYNERGIGRGRRRVSSLHNAHRSMPRTSSARRRKVAQDRGTGGRASLSNSLKATRDGLASESGSASYLSNDSYDNDNDDDSDGMDGNDMCPPCICGGDDQDSSDDKDDTDDKDGKDSKDSKNGKIALDGAGTVPNEAPKRRLDVIVASVASFLFLFTFVFVWRHQKKRSMRFYESRELAQPATSVHLRHESPSHGRQPISYDRTPVRAAGGVAPPSPISPELRAIQSQEVGQAMRRQTLGDEMSNRAVVGLTFAPRNAGRRGSSESEK